MSRLVFVILGMVILIATWRADFDQGLNYCVYWCIGLGVIAFAFRHKSREYRREGY